MIEQLDPYPGNLRKHEVAPTPSKHNSFPVDVSGKLDTQAQEDNSFRASMALRSSEFLIDQLAQAKARIGHLTEENESLRQERLTNDVFARVAVWLRDPQRKPANTAFTAGMERQICYALELDVLPHVKWMEREAELHYEAMKALLDAGEKMHDFIGELPPSIKDNASGMCEDWRTETLHAQP